MSSLKQHLERVQAKKHAQAQNKDPRLSAQRLGGRANGKTTAFQKFKENDEYMAGQNYFNEREGDGENLPPKSPDLNQLEVRFFNDWEQLSNIQSHEAKNAKKAELLPDYIPWIEGTISEGVGSQNDMLLKLMVWCLDTHELNLATDIAQFALLNNMAMPESFSRDVATVYSEQIADEGLKHIANISDHADIYKRAVELTNDHDMPDPVRAKLYRVWGNSQKDTHPTDAILAYERALKLDDGVGCKNDLKALTKPKD